VRKGQSVLLRQSVQAGFALVPKWRMAQVMPDGNGLNQVFIQVKRACNGRRHRGHVQAVFESRTQVVVFRRDEDLRLMAQAPKGAGMDDAGVVSLKLRSERTRFNRVLPARQTIVRREGRAVPESLSLSFLQLLTNRCPHVHPLARQAVIVPISW